MSLYLSEDIVEDGFAFEATGHNVYVYRQLFEGLPADLLPALLRHFNNRREWEICRLIRELLDISRANNNAIFFLEECGS